MKRIDWDQAIADIGKGLHYAERAARAMNECARAMAIPADVLREMKRRDGYPMDDPETADTP